jgi:transcription elongation factor GreB
MSRWRAPAAPSSPYITAEGALRLREELDRLWRETRPEVVRALAAAAAEGDRSENAEYQYRKRQLAGIDRRVRYLRRRLAVVKVVTERPADGRVFFGAWVRVLDGAGRESRFRIVGPDEFDHAPDYISMDSPVARALLRRAEGDEVRVELPGGVSEYVVLEVRYDAAPEAENRAR